MCSSTRSRKTSSGSSWNAQRALHRQVGTVELEDVPLADDVVVLVLHLGGDPEHVLGVGRVGRVVRVPRHRRADDPRRRRRDERLGEAARLLPRPLECPREQVELAAHLLQLGVVAHAVDGCRRARRLGQVVVVGGVELRRPELQLRVLREAGHVGVRPPAGPTAEAAHALLHVEVERDARLLAVGADVDPRRDLAAHHVVDRLADERDRTARGPRAAPRSPRRAARSARRSGAGCRCGS